MLLLTHNKNGKKGSYGINTTLPCDRLLKLGKDSVAIQFESLIIARKLYNQVLEKDWKYNQIWISFSCDTSSSKYKDLVFVYNLDTLNVEN